MSIELDGALRVAGGRDHARNGGRDTDAVLTPETLLAVSRALSTPADLTQALREALEVLNRQPGILRSGVTLAPPEGVEVMAEAPRVSAKPPPRESGLHRITIVLDGAPIGALAAHLSGETAAERERPAPLVDAVAALIADTVRVRRLHVPGGRLLPGQSLADAVASHEKRLIENALRTTRGNRARAAKLLRTTERIVGYRVQQYGIDWRAFRE